MRHVHPTVRPAAVFSTGGSNMKRLLALMVLSMFSIGMLSGCNTMAGAGKDVQKVGEKVEEKAQDCKDGKC
jgi:entericidin A